jgi:hypothetical protein
MTHALHDRILDHADALSDIAEREMAEAMAAGETDCASAWVEMAEHVAAAVRAVRVHLHPQGDLQGDPMQTREQGLGRHDKR